MSSKDNAMDHVVFVMFENRSFDNLLGHLYAPDDGKQFEGVIGKELSNPVPAWAQHQPPDGSGVVTYEVATDMDSPNPDPGEEWFHTNTQLFGTMDDHNRFKYEVTAPYNVPPAGAKPTMDGFVQDYISFVTAETGKQPTYEQYRKIMVGYTPEQVPVLNGIAKDFGVFDHWFCEVPSQTFMNRSFWTAATSCGGVVNAPASHWFKDNIAETIFDRLESKGKTWKIYVREPDPISFTAIIHWPRLKDRLDNVRPFSEFKKDAANGTLPDFCLIEPNLIVGHGDYHPPAAHALVEGQDIPVDPPSPIMSGEAFLDEVYSAYKAMRSETGANVFNTTLLIGWDEPGGTYDHVAPGAVPPPDAAAPAGQFGFTFDRSGYRVPAVVVSPWVAQGEVFNAEHRHTSLLATLRKLWDLGEPFTERDKAAAPIDYVFTLDTPRDPDTWAQPVAQPLTPEHIEWETLHRQLSGLGQAALPGLIQLAKDKGLQLPPEVEAPDFKLTPQLAWDVARLAMAHYFRALGPDEQELATIQKRVLDATNTEVKSKS